jgi:hypothetical protein
MSKDNLVSKASPLCYPPGAQSNAGDADDSPKSNRTADVVREQLSEYLTRRQAAQFIRDTLGRPFSFSTANKLAALGEFAHPDLWWGRRPLYTRADLRQWVEARSRPTKGCSLSKAVAVAAPSTTAVRRENTTALIKDS